MGTEPRTLPPLVTSFKTIAQNHSQDIDTDTIHWSYSDFPNFTCLCAYSVLYNLSHVHARISTTRLDTEPSITSNINIKPGYPFTLNYQQHICQKIDNFAKLLLQAGAVGNNTSLFIMPATQGVRHETCQEKALQKGHWTTSPSTAPPSPARCVF